MPDYIKYKHTWKIFKRKNPITNFTVHSTITEIDVSEMCASRVVYQVNGIQILYFGFQI